MNGFNDNKWGEFETQRLSRSGHMHQDHRFHLEVSFVTNNHNLQGTPRSTQLSKISQIFRMSVKWNMTHRRNSTISFYCGKSHVVGRATPSKLINAVRFTSSPRMSSQQQEQQLRLSKLVLKEFFTRLNKNVLIQANLSDTYKLKHASKMFFI